MKKHVQSAVILSIMGLLMTSCGSNNPESTGKAISKKECDCSREDNERFFSKNIAAHKQLLSEAKEGKFATMTEYQKKKSELFQDVYGRDEESRTCKEELKKMQQEAELKFVEENDRMTIMNSYKANLRVCEEENRKIHQTNLEEIKKLEEENKAISFNF